jgi:hypothetical protein
LSFCFHGFAWAAAAVAVVPTLAPVALAFIGSSSFLRASTGFLVVVSFDSSKGFGHPEVQGHERKFCTQSGIFGR